MIKKIRKELLVLIFLILGVFISSKLDLFILKKTQALNSATKDELLKKFFDKITIIGDSFWVFLFSIAVLFAGYFLKKKIKKETYEKTKIFFLFLIFSSLLTGLLTQIIKHIVGRPRPNQALSSGSFDLSFFNFDSAYHSFPSGHTSTIFIVALVMCILTPKIKFIYIFFASIVAISRVFVGAHFFTDIIGGVMVAFIGFKIMHIFFNKINNKEQLSFSHTLNSNYFFLSVIVFLISVVLVSFGDSLDILVSLFFYEGQNTFVLQKGDLFTILVRKILLPLILLYMIIVPFLSVMSGISQLFFGYVFKLKEICFIVSTLFVNLILVVNALLKNSWGRARPDEILQFGGNEDFTPWYQLSSACNTNCSFVSGDAATGFSLIVLFFLTKNKIFIWLSISLGFLLGITRILEGGHFLSDILVGGLVIYVLTYLQFIFYNKIFNTNA